MDVMESEDEVNTETRKSRIKFYKTVLNIFKGRSLSMDAANHYRNSTAWVPQELQTPASLRESVGDIQKEITWLQSLKDCVLAYHSSLTCLELPTTHNVQQRENVLNIMQAVRHVTECLAETLQQRDHSHIEVKQKYIIELDKFRAGLERQKEVPNSVTRDEEMTRRIGKATKRIEKINSMRELKARLIGAFASDHESLPELQQLRSERRVLNLEDFVGTAQM